MPELPDVEGFRRYLRRHAEGRRVERVEAEPDIVRNTSPQGLGRALRGRRLGTPHRRGKWLCCPVDGRTLVLHFGMTGRLVWSGEEPERHPHDRIVLSLDGGELRYRAQRKLGGAWLARSGEDPEELIGRLGPDALEIGPDRMVRVLREKRGRIKAALMDQETVAGLGNLTVDEILWRARVDPRRSIAGLEEDELRRIARSTRDVLRVSVEEGRVPPKRSWLTGRRDRDGAACPRCGTGLERASVAGRTAVLCPRCQESS